MCILLGVSHAIYSPGSFISETPQVGPCFQARSNASPCPNRSPPVRGRVSQTTLPPSSRHDPKTLCRSGHGRAFYYNSKTNNSPPPSHPAGCYATAGMSPPPPSPSVVRAYMTNNSDSHKLKFLGRHGRQKITHILHRFCLPDLFAGPGDYISYFVMTVS